MLWNSEYLFIYLSYLNKNVLTFSPSEFSQCEDGSTMESSTHLKKKHARLSIINAFLFHSHMSVIFSTDSFGFKLISPACLSGLSS